MYITWIKDILKLFKIVSRFKSIKSSEDYKSWMGDLAALILLLKSIFLKTNYSIPWLLGMFLQTSICTAGDISFTYGNHDLATLKLSTCWCMKIKIKRKLKVSQFFFSFPWYTKVGLTINQQIHFSADTPCVGCHKMWSNQYQFISLNKIWVTHGPLKIKIIEV